MVPVRDRHGRSERHGMTCWMGRNADRIQGSLGAVTGPDCSSTPDTRTANPLFHHGEGRSTFDCIPLPTAFNSRVSSWRTREAVCASSPRPLDPPADHSRAPTYASLIGGTKASLRSFTGSLAGPKATRKLLRRLTRRPRSRYSRDETVLNPAELAGMVRPRTMERAFRASPPRERRGETLSRRPLTFMRISILHFIGGHFGCSFYRGRLAHSCWPSLTLREPWGWGGRCTTASARCLRALWMSSKRRDSRGSSRTRTI